VSELTVGTAFSGEPDRRNPDSKSGADIGIVALQKLFEQIEDDERRVLSILIDLNIAFLSAGLIIDILRACF
jgi:hypothetical protein